MKNNNLFDEILDVMHFDYYIDQYGRVRLLDNEGANLGGIEDEYFSIDEYTCTAILERMDSYIYDYFINDVNEVTGNDYESVQEILDDIVNVQNKNIGEGELLMISAIANPEQLRLSKGKINESGYFDYHLNIAKYQFSI